MRLKSVLGAASIAVLAVAAAAVAQQARWATANDQIAQSLIAMERQWAEESCTHKLVVQTLLADDFEGTSPEGKRYTKSQAIAYAESSKEVARDCLLNNVDVHFFGDSIAIAYGSESWTTRADNGTDQKRCLIWTDTWLKRNGTWQIVAAQDMPFACK